MMAGEGRTIFNPVTGQRLTFLMTGDETGGELFRAEGVFPPGGFAGVKHVHPTQDEHFRVEAGRAAFLVDGGEVVLGPGAQIDVPARRPHTFRNAGADEMRVVFEFRPAPPSTQRFYELYFGFAQQGRVNAAAMPGLLDLAVVWPETSAHAVLARPPAWCQNLLLGALGPLARALGRLPPACERAAPSAPVADVPRTRA
jgi:mannose-6-phosphate isomerase-like protein (cupin superfamily)